MNLQDVTAHWVALHEALGLGAPVVSDGQYQQLLTAVDALEDGTSGDEAERARCRMVSADQGRPAPRSIAGGVQVDQETWPMSQFRPK
jgi:hypothetical protein